MPEEKNRLGVTQEEWRSAESQYDVVDKALD